MHLTHFRPSRKVVFWTLLGVSSLTLLMPPRITDGIKHGTQLLVPLQDMVYFATFQGARTVSRVSASARDASVELQQLRNEIVSQAGLIQQLQAENAELSVIRSKSVPGALHAHVVGRDIVEWRNSLLIERGSKLGVSPNDWAASRLFINQGGISDIREGDAVIAREVLLGRVEQVSPFMSRVCLFTDVDSAPVKVRIGGIENGHFAAVDYACSLHGMGRGRMIVKNVDYRHVERAGAVNEGATSESAADTPIMPDRPRGIRVGDFVYSAPGQLGLPTPLVIGQVREISEDPSRRLVYDIIVEPAVRLDEIRTVSVIPLISTNIAMDQP